jgi:hypothetical protein
MGWRDEGESESRGWFGRLHLSWPMLLLAGWLLYEFTAQPGLAALVACAKFGWADARTAFWLRRVDPDRPRGRTCFWCYLTFGLWKVVVMAMLTMIVLGCVAIILECILQKPVGNNDLVALFQGSIAAAVIGVGLLCLTCYIALWIARRNGVRIWMGHAPRRARQERFWPPRHGRFNAAPFVIFTALGASLLMAVGLMVALLLLFMPGGFWGTLIVLISLGIPAAVVLGFNDAAKRLFARSPQECWVAEEGEEAYQIRGVKEEVGQA